MGEEFIFLPDACVEIKVLMSISVILGPFGRPFDMSSDVRGISF